MCLCIHPERWATIRTTSCNHEAKYLPVKVSDSTTRLTHDGYVEMPTPWDGNTWPATKQWLVCETSLGMLLGAWGLTWPDTIALHMYLSKDFSNFQHLLWGSFVLGHLLQMHWASQALFIVVVNGVLEERLKELMSWHWCHYVSRSQHFATLHAHEQKGQKGTEKQRHRRIWNIAMCICTFERRASWHTWVRTCKIVKEGETNHWSRITWNTEVMRFILSVRGCV